MNLNRSEEANPVGRSYGDICPSGHYCPAHSHAPTPCDPGTYNPDDGSEDINACLSCPPGKYCDVAGLSNYTEECDPGIDIYE